VTVRANSAFHPSGVGKCVPASAGKAKAGMVHSVSGWMNAGCAGKTVRSLENASRVPYLSALEVCSRRGAIQIITLPYGIESGFLRFSKKTQNLDF